VITASSARTATGGPSAILRPALITTQRSQRADRVHHITRPARWWAVLAQRLDEIDTDAELARIEAGEPFVEEEGSGSERQGAPARARFWSI
jgi:hypothetical protein